MGIGTRGLGDSGTWDSGMRGRGTRGRRDVGRGTRRRGDSGTGDWGLGTGDSKTLRLGDVGRRGLEDLINKQHMIFSVLSRKVLYAGEFVSRLVADDF